MGRSLFDTRTRWERITDVFRLGGQLVFGISVIGLLFLMGTILAAWAEILFVGILHGEYWNHIPTMSFGTAFKLNAVVILFAFIIRMLGEIVLTWFKDVIE
jgi:hypothetical protein